MATITEDYVSFETAKLLKEKGFCGQYHMYYVEDGKYICSDLHDIKDYAKSIIQFDYLHRTKVPAPTLQMAMKWLREVHNWTICISPYWPEGDMRNKLTWYYDIHSLIDNRSFREYSYTDNYTEACEAAIKYCLENLI